MRRLEWWCLDWNKPSIDFYLSPWSRTNEGLDGYRIAGDTLERLAKEEYMEK